MIAHLRGPHPRLPTFKAGVARMGLARMWGDRGNLPGWEMVAH